MCVFQRWWFELFVIGNKICIVGASGKTELMQTFVRACVALIAQALCVRGASVPVLLDRPDNVYLHLVVNIGLALSFLAAAIKYKPYADDAGHTGWTVADKTQVLQLLMLLVQYAMAALCMAIDDASGTARSAWQEIVHIVTTAVIIVTILLPFVYVLLLYHGRDPLACTRRPSAPTEGVPASTVGPFDDTGGEEPPPLPHTGRQNRAGTPTHRRVEAAGTPSMIGTFDDTGGKVPPPPLPRSGRQRQGCPGTPSRRPMNTQAQRPTERVQHHVNPLAELPKRLPPPALPSAEELRQWRQEQ